jgi:hypothetical protein
MSGPELDLQARARQVYEQIYEEHCAAGRRIPGLHLRASSDVRATWPSPTAELRAQDKDEGSARRNGDRAAQHK